MKNPKLIEGLKMLDKEEWISLRKYVLMYCTKSSDNYRLLDFLFSVRSSLVDLSEVEVIKKPLFDQMTHKQFSNLMSRLFLWFEEWLIWHEQQKNEIAREVDLVKIYNRRGAYYLADKIFSKVEKKLLAQQKLDLSTHRNLYQVYHNHYFSDNPVKYKRKEEILETLISYYILQVKEHAQLYIAEMHNWGRIQNYDFSKDIVLLTQMKELIPDTETSQVVELISALVVDLDADAFIKLKEIVLSGRLVPDSELYILAVFYMIASSMMLWNNNKISDPQLVLDAYDYGLESGVLLNTRKMPLVRFINLISTFGFMQTSEKTYAFIDKWKHQVADEDEEAIRALGYAQLKFIEGKLDEIIPLLIGQKYETDSGRLRSSLLELVGLYSDRKNNYSLLVNRINNFKRVLRVYGSKRSNMAHRSFLNFTKVLELLVKRDFAKLSIKLDNYNPIIYKKWLEKELKAGRK